MEKFDFGWELNVMNEARILRESRGLRVEDLSNFLRRFKHEKFLYGVSAGGSFMEDGYLMELFSAKNYELNGVHLKLGSITLFCVDFRDEEFCMLFNDTVRACLNLSSVRIVRGHFELNNLGWTVNMLCSVPCVKNVVLEGMQFPLPRRRIGVDLSGGGFKLNRRRGAVDSSCADCRVERLCWKKSSIVARCMSIRQSTILACGTLRVLELVTLGLTDNNVGYLCGGLKKCCKLEKLDLSNNYLDYGGLCLLKGALSGVCERGVLKEFLYSSNKLLFASGPVDNGHSIIPTCESLDFSNNQLGDLGCRNLEVHLSLSWSRLKVLSLRRSRIGLYFGFKHFVNGLKFCSNLVSVDISGNRLHCQCCKDFLGCLHLLNCLESISMSDIAMDDECVGVLSELLCERTCGGDGRVGELRICPQLSRLDIGCNWVSHFAGAEFGSMLCVSGRAMERVDVRDNNFGDSGVGAILGGLCVRPLFFDCLREIDISWCRLRDGGCERVKESLPLLVKLENFSVGWNFIGATGFLDILEGFRGLSLSYNFCRGSFSEIGFYFEGNFNRRGNDECCDKFSSWVCDVYKDGPGVVGCGSFKSLNHLLSFVSGGGLSELGIQSSKSVGDGCGGCESVGKKAKRVC